MGSFPVSMCKLAAIARLKTPTVMKAFRAVKTPDGEWRNMACLEGMHAGCHLKKWPWLVDLQTESRGDAGGLSKGLNWEVGLSSHSLPVQTAMPMIA